MIDRVAVMSSWPSGRAIHSGHIEQTCEKTCFFVWFFNIYFYTSVRFQSEWTISVSSENVIYGYIIGAYLLCSIILDCAGGEQGWFLLEPIRIICKVLPVRYYCKNDAVSYISDSLWGMVRWLVMTEKRSIRTWKNYCYGGSGERGQVEDQDASQDRHGWSRGYFRWNGGRIWIFLVCEMECYFGWNRAWYFLLFSDDRKNVKRNTWNGIHYNAFVSEK